MKTSVIMANTAASASLAMSATSKANLVAGGEAKDTPARGQEFDGSIHSRREPTPRSAMDGNPDGVTTPLK